MWMDLSYNLEVESKEFTIDMEDEEKAENKNVSQPCSSTRMCEEEFTNTGKNAVSFCNN